jgi:hypothetical protein
MDPEEKCISARLYDILLKHCHEDETSETSDEEFEESDEEYPLECCLCAELFFDLIKFNLHQEKECSEIKDPQKDVIKAHKCSFEDCSKSFTKSAELRKHEVSLVFSRQRIFLN